MNSSRPQSVFSPDPIGDAAVAWLLERETGFSRERAEEFARWCAADSRHAAAVAQVEKAMHLLDDLPKVELPAQMSRELASVQALSPAHPAWRGLRWAAGMAAAIALTATVWWLALAPKTPHTSGELYYVAQSQSPQQVALNDGSLVDVNSNSRMQIRLLQDERHVDLESGEAHFEVAHDVKRPFVVAAGGIYVRALGTAFTVNIRDSGVEVLVVEGRVEISKSPDLPSVVASADRPRVGAQEHVWVPHDTAMSELHVAKVDAELMQQTLAWHSPVTNFSNRPLRDIVSLFNRRNAVQIVLADAATGDLKIGGTFAIDQPQAFARVLSQYGEVVAEPHGKDEILLKLAR